MTTPLLAHLQQLGAERESAGLTRRVSVREQDGLLDLAGNDYLALLQHPLVTAGAIRAVKHFGGGAGASRLVTGTVAVHQQLERELAALTGADSALVMSSGYHANLSAVTALADAGSTIVSDAHVHASLIDAARLARGRVVVTPHNDVAAVREAVRAASGSRVLVVAESIYSVLGDAAPLAELAQLARDEGATLLVDEAHGLGVVGERGEGMVAALGLWDEFRDHLVVTMTLSKALASQGGVVLGPRLVREHLVNTARPFIYDTGLAPAAAGAALGALQAIREEPWRPARVGEAMAVLAHGLGVDRPAGAVLSLGAAGPQEALDAVAALAGQGIRIGCFRPPSSPDGQSRLRLTVNAGLDDAQLATAVAALAPHVGH